MYSNMRAIHLREETRARHVRDKPLLSGNIIHGWTLRYEY